MELILINIFAFFVNDGMNSNVP